MQIVLMASWRSLNVGWKHRRCTISKFDDRRDVVWCKGENANETVSDVFPLKFRRRCTSARESLWLRVFCLIIIQSVHLTLYSSLSSWQTIQSLIMCQSYEIHICTRIDIKSTLLAETPHQVFNTHFELLIKVVIKNWHFNALTFVGLFFLKLSFSGHQFYSHEWNFWLNVFSRAL